MKIHNCLTITDDDSVLSMQPDELKDFSGNVVYSKARLPKEVFEALQDTIPSLADKNAASAYFRGAAMNEELIGATLGD